MKKMMIIAAMVGAMLIPAQMEASNKVNNRVKVEYKNRKEPKKFKEEKRFDGRKDFDKARDYNRKPDRPEVIVINNQKPCPLPPPPAPVKVVYESNPVSAVASVIGLAALAAIIAN